MGFWMDKARQEILPAAVFPQLPKIRFVPQQKVCACGATLKVQKTRRKKVISLTGPFIAHETVLECRSCSKIFKADALPQMVQPRCNVAYDVIVFIGRALFLKHRSTQEVLGDLNSRNIRICASEVDYLGRKFISFLAMAHRRATPRIRDVMAKNGGYVLHLDATHEGDAPALMTGLDGLSKIVLANVKIPTESSDHIIPFFQEIKTTYGSPKACVHDMGTGLCKAVAEVFPQIPDFICHFHFLRDIGKDYLEPAYRDLRNRLRGHAATSRLRKITREARQQLGEQCPQLQELSKLMFAGNLHEDCLLLILMSSYSLALWALQAKHSGNGYGFPFDLPLLHFAERILELHKLLPKILQQYAGAKAKEKKLLLKLERIASDIDADEGLYKSVEELRRRVKIFGNLRKAMRIAPLVGGNGLNDDGTSEALSSIRQRVALFRSQLDTNTVLADDPLSRKMAEQIDKYNEKLFADPIEVDTLAGKKIICPQRTNNILEQFFRKLKRGQRRKTGNNSMNRMLRAMLADTPLVKNMDNPKYMEILLDGKTSLEQVFSELSKSEMEKVDDKSQSNIDRILPGFRKLIRNKKFPEKLLNIFIDPEKIGLPN